MNTQKITLDVTKRPQVAPIARFGEGDHDGTTLEATILDDGAALPLADYSVRLCIRMPDGKTYYSVDGESEGNVATFLVDEQYLSPHGKTDCAYVEVRDGDELVCSTSRFSAVILRSAKDGAELSEQYITEVDEAIERCGDAAEAADTAADAAEQVLEHGIPLMAADRRGGAKLGTGLTMTGELLGVDVAAAGGVTSSEKGAANGVAELDQNGLVLSSQLPSYVDDVLEYPSAQDFPATGESGKIYVATDTNLTYRWTGSTYAEISPSLALGETSSTAYRGDRGAAAYAHAVTNKGAAFSSKLYKITTNSEGHVTAATPVTSADIVAFLNAQALTPASVTATGAIQGTSISDGTGTLAQLRDSVSRTFRFTKLNSSHITIPSGQSVSLPDGYTSATMALICGYGYDGMRFTHLGSAGSINIPVAGTASTIGELGFNVGTGMITNGTGITVIIMDVYAVTVNG